MSSTADQDESSRAVSIGGDEGMLAGGVVECPQNFDAIPTRLPLELQERVIILGPPHGRDRVAFLCLCSLVCKHWLPRSRSLLSLKVDLQSIEDMQSFVVLMRNPLTTLSRSIRTLGLTLKCELLEDAAAAIAAAGRIPSISKLVCYYNTFKAIISNGKPLSSVTDLKLFDGHFDSADQFAELIGYFPALNSLRLVNVKTQCSSLLSFSPEHVILVPSLALGFGTKGVSVLRQCPMLKRLRINTDGGRDSMDIARWFSEQQRANIYLILENTGVPDHLDADPAFNLLLKSARSLLIFSPAYGFETILPRWIEQAEGLESITISNLDDDPQVLRCTDWAPLAKSLKGAKQLKTVRFKRWGQPEMISKYIQMLSALATPKVSILVEASELCYRDHVEEEVYII